MATNLMYYIVLPWLMKKTSVVTLRLSKRDLRRLEELRRVDDLDRSTMIKMLIEEGMRRRVVELYRREKLTSGRAAEILGVSLREFLEILEREGVPINWDMESIRAYLTEKDLKRFEKWWTNHAGDDAEIKYKVE